MRFREFVAAVRADPVRRRNLRRLLVRLGLPLACLLLILAALGVLYLWPTP